MAAAIGGLLDRALKRARTEAFHAVMLARSGASLGTVIRWAGFRLRRLVRRPPADAEQAEADFQRLTAGGRFTSTWFDRHIRRWVETLGPLRDAARPLDILEIGSWEGRSTLFLLTWFPGSTLTAVDTWDGGGEPRDGGEAGQAEARFDANLAPYASRVTKLKGPSAGHLARLLAVRPESFDLAYVDGSHYADDVMVDAVSSWGLLKRGGIVIFDDYLWDGAVYPVAKRPGRAINLFLRLVAGESRMLECGTQVVLRKTVSTVEAFRRA